MTIFLRPADLESDRDLIVQHLARNLNPLSDGRRFDWLYRNNPHGKARVWMAFDTASQAVVGTAAAFPRRLYVGDRQAVGWVLGDFCIDEPYRTLGPALQLQRACLAAVDSEAVSFCYDFPSTGMMAIYKRLGISPCQHLLRLARPLRVDRKVREHIKPSVAAHGLTAAGNLMLRFFHHRPRAHRTSAIALHTGACGEEFSVIARELGGQ
jgi:hypothetical protein